MMAKKMSPEQKARWNAAGERLERFFALLEERVKVDERLAREKSTPRAQQN
jgi:hypothetical protein